MKFSTIMMLRMLVVAAALFAVSASAQSSLRMAFQTSNGSVSTIEANALSLTVNAGKLLAANGTESLEFNLQELVKMYFTSDESGLELFPVEMAVGEVTAYTLEGRLAGSFDSTASALAGLAPGVYVIKVGDNESFKIAVQ